MNKQRFIIVIASMLSLALWSEYYWRTREHGEHQEQVVAGEHQVAEACVQTNWWDSYPDAPEEEQLPIVKPYRRYLPIATLMARRQIEQDDTAMREQIIRAEAVQRMQDRYLEYLKADAEARARWQKLMNDRAYIDALRNQPIIVSPTYGSDWCY